MNEVVSQFHSNFKRFFLPDLLPNREGKFQSLQFAGYDKNTLGKK